MLLGGFIETIEMYWLFGIVRGSRDFRFRLLRFKFQLCVTLLSQLTSSCVNSNI